MKRDNKKLFYLLGAFLTCFIPRAIMACNMVPLIVPRDEASTLAGAAFFSGNDWSNVIGHGGFYYGCGYTMLFAPLLKITQSPFVLYKSILLVSAFLFAMVAPIAYHISEKYFAIKNPKLLFVLSIVCSYMVTGTVGPVAMNEAPLILMVWLTAWALIKLVYAETKKSKIIYTLIIFLILSYALTLHARAITLWIGLIILIPLYYIIYRKWLISLPCLAVFGTMGYVAARLYITYVQNSIWILEEGSKLANSSVGVKKSIFELLGQSISWKAIFYTVIGQLNTINIYTAGMAVICMAFLCPMIIKVISKRENILMDTGIIVVFIYFILCVAITVGGQSITWLSDTIYALESGKGTDAYGFRAFTYLRYFGCYVGPILLCGLVSIIRTRNIRYYIKYAIGIIAILHLLWLTLIIPYLKNSNAAIDIFTSLALKNWDDLANIHIYLSGTVALFSIGTIIVLLMLNNKKVLMIGILGMFLMFETVYLYGTYVSKSQEQIKNVDAGNYLYNQVKDNGDILDEIYVPNIDIAYYYQVMFIECKVINDSPDKSEDNAMIFTNDFNDIQKYEGQGYTSLVLDDNEIVLLKGKKYKTIVKNAGYNVE